MSEVTTESNTTEVPKQRSEYLESLDMLLSSIEVAAKLKGGLTMKDCRQIKDSRDILVEYFTLEEGETELSEPTRIETDALALLISILETQQLSGVFSIDGSIRILEAIEKLSDIIAEKKSVSQKMADAKRKLKGKK